MKEDNDKRLQQLIEEGSALQFETLSGSDEKDFLAYQTLFNQLKTEPGSGLSYAFAANVRRAVELKAIRKSNIRFYIAAAVIFAFVTIAGYFMLALVNKEAGSLALAITLKYKWVLLMSLLTFIGLQFFNPSTPHKNLVK